MLVLCDRAGAQDRCTSPIYKSGTGKADYDMAVSEPSIREAVKESGLKHLAFIMDGNGRWAKKRGMPRNYGHRIGASTFRKIAQYCSDIGIEYITVYAFSTENWRRPKKEVDSIMKLLSDYLDESLRDYKKYHCHVRMIGDLSVFDAQELEKIRQLDEISAGMPSQLQIALNYGGRHELVQAYERLMANGITHPTEQQISDALYTAGVPDPDMIVRTGGEKRLSNFLLWQCAYAEFCFTDTLWPDMSGKDVDVAVREFCARKRNYGRVPTDSGAGVGKL